MSEWSATATTRRRCSSGSGASARADHGGQVFYFCSDHFATDPDRHPDARHPPEGTGATPVGLNRPSGSGRPDQTSQPRLSSPVSA